MPFSRLIIPPRAVSRAFMWGLVVLCPTACRPGSPPPSDTAHEGCGKDTDCKSDRICDEGRCVAPPGAETLHGAPAPTPPDGGDRWRRGGPGGDAPSLARGPRAAPKMVWDVDLGAVIYARATLATGAEGAPVAYVGTHAGRFVGVVAEGPHEGELVLDLTLGGMVWGTAALGDDGRLYVGADDDHLYAIDPGAGEIAWKLHLGDCKPTRAPGPEGARCDVDGGPTVGPGGDLYVGADGVYRLGRDGTIRWHWPDDVERPRHVFSAPVVTTEGLVVFGGQDGFVTALDTDGALRWRHKVVADVDGSAAVGIDGTFYVGGDDGRVHALRSDGSLKWSFVAQKDIRSAIAVAPDGNVYVTSFDGNLYALDPAGNVRWVLPTAGRIAASPVLDADGVVYVGSQDDHLYAVTESGDVRWSVEFPTDIDASVAIAPGGTLVVGTDDGHLRGLR